MTFTFNRRRLILIRQDSATILCHPVGKSWWRIAIPKHLWPKCRGLQSKGTP